MLSLVLVPVGLFAQNVYGEIGLNSLSKINYINSDHNNFTSKSTASQYRSELGFKYALSDKLVTHLGFSKEKYSFIMENKSQPVNIASLFELDYLGGNLGVDYLLYHKHKWNIFACGKFSRHVLSRGERTDEFMGEEINSINLIQDDDFSQIRHNVQAGLELDYKISYSASVYARYNFNQSITVKENVLESYNFNSHVFSLGIILHMDKYAHKRTKTIDVAPVNAIEQTLFIDQSDEPERIDSSSVLADEIFLIDSTRLKIYFPPNSAEFYDSHIKPLAKVAESLLETPSMKYQITGYYDKILDKNDAMKRVEAVLEYFIEQGVPQEQFVLNYSEEYDPYSTAANVWSRRVELVKRKIN